MVSLLCSALYIVLGLIGSLIGLLCLKDLIWYLRTLKYTKQGIPLRYFPFIGFAGLIASPGAENGLEKFHKIFTKKGEAKRTEPIVAINGLTSDTFIMLNDKDLVKRYFDVETKVSYTDNILGFPFKNTFAFSKNGHKPLSDRAIFAEIFFTDNLRKQVPGIRAIVQKHLNRIKDEVRKLKSGDDFTEVELKPFIRSIFKDVVSLVLFGGEIPEVDGETMVNQIIKVTEGYFHNSTSIPHIITGGWSSKLLPSKEFAEINAIHQKVIRKLREVVTYRMNSKEYTPGCNAVDLLIAKNNSLQEQGKTDQMLTMEEIIDNIYVVIFAGMDTSKNLTQFSLTELSKQRDIQSKLRKDVHGEIFGKGLGDGFDEYDQCELLDIFLKESLRVYTPGWIGAYRKVVKSFKLGPYKIHKGSMIFISFITLFSRPEDFANSKVFDLKKYDDKKKIKELSKFALIPFSAGKRRCIGRNLAEMVVKVILSNFLEEFDLEKSQEPNRSFAGITLTLKHCRIRLRCRD